MIRRSCQFLCTALALGISSAALAFQPPPFPRLGGVNYGTPFNYSDANYEAQLAKLNVVIVENWPGFKPGGQSWDSIIANIKAKNPNELVFYYVLASELGSQSDIGSAWDTFRNKMSSMGWWLYPSGTSGTIVPSWFKSTWDTINVTKFTPKDSNGDDAIDWIAKYFVSSLYTPNSSADGFFLDNTTWEPLVNGDWNRDGVTDSQSSAQAGQWIRQGMAEYYTKMHQLMPGKYQIGNVTNLGLSQAVFPEYTGLINGGLLEGYIGKSWSYETWGGWQSMMASYRKVMAAMAAPKVVIFNQWGNPTDYQAMRYGLGSCLMDDGYYAFTDQSKGYTGVVWFDEYDAKLGQATQPPPTAAWQSGVYRRDFANGIVLVNPKGNGPKTVTLETGFVKLKGTQAPSVNNGQTVTSVSLNDRDGIILLRQHPVSRPQPPTSIKASLN